MPCAVKIACVESSTLRADARLSPRGCFHQKRNPHLPRFTISCLTAVLSATGAAVLRKRIYPPDGREGEFYMVPVDWYCRPALVFSMDENMYSREQIRKLVLQVIEQELGIDAHQLDADTRLQHELGIDSLERLELISSLEDRLGVWLGEKAGWRICQLGELVDALYQAQEHQLALPVAA